MNAAPALIASQPIAQEHPAITLVREVYSDEKGVLEFRPEVPDGKSAAAKDLQNKAHRLRAFVPIDEVDGARIIRYINGCEA